MAGSESGSVTDPDGLCMNGEFPVYLLARRRRHGFRACCTHSGWWLLLTSDFHWLSSKRGGTAGLG